MIFLKEVMFKMELPPTQQPLKRLLAESRWKVKKTRKSLTPSVNFELAYICDVMKRRGCSRNYWYAFVTRVQKSF